MDTRQQILEKNFHSIWLNGYQGTRTDKVIEGLGITKGAFYHYFASKQVLGYAVVDEIIAPMFVNTWKVLESTEGNPIEQINKVLRGMINNTLAEQVVLGCPLNNLMQEMSPLDDGFRTRFQGIINQLRTFIENALRRGQDNNTVTNTIDPTQVALFVLAGLEGSYSIAKSLQSKEAFKSSVILSKASSISSSLMEATFLYSGS